MPSMDFEKMLNDLAMEYPSIKEKTMDLKDDVMDLMADESPDEMPELELADEEDISLEL